MIKVSVYSIASFFSLAVLLVAQNLAGDAGARFMGESLGLIIVLLSCQICFHLNGVDELLIDSKLQIFVQKMLKSGGAGLLIAALLFHIFPRLSPGYAAAAASACFLMFALVVLRPVVRSIARRHEHRGTVIVGSGIVATKLFTSFIGEDAHEGVRIVDYPELEQISDRQNVSRIVIADTEVRNEAAVTQALIDFKLRGIPVETAGASFERTARKVWIEGLSPHQLIFSEGFCPSKAYVAMKRVLDIVLSLAVLPVAAPLMALIAIAIRLESTGRVIFSQERVGHLGKRFTVYKFRSMREDAETGTGPTWAKENDDRITRVGAVLRKCRLDELPQVWNVLRGEMSFVGPRPERPYFVELLKERIPFYDVRHYVKPGITGWAQVMFPYGASVEDSYQKLQYDLYYTKNASLRLDLLTLLKTVKVVLAGEGR